jgi:biopolymer transport protein ExbB/TolQ
MRKNKLRSRLYGKITAIVILLSFLKFPMYGEPLTEQQQNLTENEMRFWSDLEVDLLIEEISEAAYEAIEQAASEAARAAMLANLEREVALIRQAQQWRNEAELRQQAITEAKKAGRKNTFLAAVIGILGGLVVGVGGTLIIGGR